MSADEQDSSVSAPPDRRSLKSTNPALWGLLGVLAGSLASGTFSVAAAQVSFKANEATIQAERELNKIDREQKKEEFVREQRVNAYGKFMSDSQAAETAQADYLNSIMANNSDENHGYFFVNMEDKQRQFLISAWSVELFASERLKATIHDMTRILDSRYTTLSRFTGDRSNFDAVSALWSEIQNSPSIEQPRLNFTQAATEDINS